MQDPKEHKDVKMFDVYLKEQEDGNFLYHSFYEEIIPKDNVPKFKQNLTLNRDHFETKLKEFNNVKELLLKKEKELLGLKASELDCLKDPAKWIKGQRDALLKQFDEKMVLEQIKESAQMFVDNFEELKRIELLKEKKRIENERKHLKLKLDEANQELQVYRNVKKA